MERTTSISTSRDILTKTRGAEDQDFRKPGHRRGVRNTQEERDALMLKIKSYADLKQKRRKENYRRDLQGSRKLTKVPGRPSHDSPKTTKQSTSTQR